MLLLCQPFLSYFGLFFCWFLVFVFFLYFFLMLFHKSSFYVLVFVSVVLGFLGFILCYLLDLFFVIFGFCFLRV